MVKDSVLSLPRAWVQSLVGELRSRKPHGAAKLKKKKNSRVCILGEHNIERSQLKFLCILGCFLY